MDVSPDLADRTVRNVLPDWTRMPLTAGAPPAVLIQSSNGVLDKLVL